MRHAPFALSLSLGLAACAAGPHERPARAIAQPCVTVAVWSNGVHTSLSVPASIMGADHPIRRLAPDARYFLIGWGERAFYQSDGTRAWLALDAVIPPSPSTVHVLASDIPPETWFTPGEAPTLGIAAANAPAMARFFADALTLAPDGAAQVIGPGQVPGQSWFLEAREGFHLFNMCNRWTARALQAGGVEARAWFGWSADGVARQAAQAPLCAPAPDLVGSS